MLWVERLGPYAVALLLMIAAIPLSLNWTRPKARRWAKIIVVAGVLILIVAVTVDLHNVYLSWQIKSDATTNDFWLKTGRIQFIPTEPGHVDVVIPEMSLTNREDKDNVFEIDMVIGVTPNGTA